MVVSLGSINMDLVIRCSHAPLRGETVMAVDSIANAGGKGANQAVQAARMGAKTIFVGRVGADPFGRQLIETLCAYGVGMNCVAVDQTSPSGMAVVIVEDDGSNRIVVVPGANGAVGEAELKMLDDLLEPGSVLSLQCEIPFGIVREAARCGRRKGATVLLDPSPAQAIVLSPGVFDNVDYLMPNEGEACALSGERDVFAAARTLLRFGARTVVVKMGEKGAMAVGAYESPPVSAFNVAVQDTTGAGDSFQGAFAASLDYGYDPERALRRAMAAGALTVTKLGAQQAMPSGSEVDAFLQSQPCKG